VEVVRTDGHDPAARRLVDAMVGEVGAIYERGMPAGPSATPEELSPAAGGGFVLYNGSPYASFWGEKALNAPGART
jgi:hypothetical protein